MNGLQALTVRGDDPVADITFTPASFTQAFRSYAAEQGNDPSIAKVKAVEVADQTVSLAGGKSELTSDSVYISPAAAQLYAESVKRQKTVSRRSEVQSRPTRSATADESDLEAAGIVTFEAEATAEAEERLSHSAPRTYRKLHENDEK